MARPGRRAAFGQRSSALLLLPGVAYLVLFFLVPVGFIAYYSLGYKPALFGSVATDRLSLDRYAEALGPTFLATFTNTLQIALIGTVLCLLLGFPVAYWIALLSPKRWRNLLLLAFVLPLWTSSLLRSYAWISILRPTGVLNTLLASLHLPTLDLLNRTPAVVIGMTYGLLPYMVLILYASLEKLDRCFLEAAADLGATPPQAFWKVTVPQTLPGIAAGSLLVFITGLGDFINPELLGGTSSMTAARLIYNQFLGATQNWGFGSALSMVLILAVSLAIALLIKYGDKNASSL